MANKRPVWQRLADAADKEGLTAQDLATNSKLLKRHRISQRSLTGPLIHRAIEYHQEQMESLRARANALNERGRPSFESEGEVVSPSQPSFQNKVETKMAATLKPAKRKKLVFDKYSATSIIRWMGSKNWSVEEARAVIDQLTKGIKDSTLKIQLRDGAKGEDGTHGAPAELTAAERKQVNAKRKAFKAKA